MDRKNPVEVREANKYMLADAAVALFVAFLLNFAVLSCFAELFFHIGNILQDKEYGIRHLILTLPFVCALR